MKRDWDLIRKQLTDVEEENDLFANKPIEPTQVEAFTNAILKAGGRRSIGAVFRPKERAYLMHWSYKLFKGLASADKIPHMKGVAIEWDHGSDAASVAAAEEMCRDYQIHDLGTTPALHSQHEERLAIDISISWTGTLAIENKGGTIVNIGSEPKTGMNSQLIAVGASYGVVKYNRSGTDKPHWSFNGA